MLQFYLVDYPEVEKKIPLAISITSLPVKPITFLPTPKSDYFLDAGSNLTLSFEIKDPQNCELKVSVDFGSASQFSEEFIVVDGGSSFVKLEFMPQVEQNVSRS